MQSTLEAVRDHLPESLRHLSTIISLNSLLILIKNKGGTRLVIPSKPTPDHDLLVLIGTDDFKKLAYFYSGDVLSIPRCTKLLTLVRDIGILQDSRSRTPIKEIAMKYGMTERGIQKALRRIEPKERQPWLKDLQSVITATL